MARDLADVAVVATQTAWATGLAAAWSRSTAGCDYARRRGWKQLGAKDKRAFTKRYDDLVAMGLAANKEPARRKRDPVERRSFNLATAFANHKRSILRFMNDIQVPLNEQPGGARLEALQNSTVNLGLFPQSSRRRAVRRPSQLPVDHPQERHLGHRRSQPALPR